MTRVGEGVICHSIRFWVYEHVFYRVVVCHRTKREFHIMKHDVAIGSMGT